ncbi:NADH-cytochrome b5 reductase-like [Anneissia japonica]|uniref:NADH-cytochrome b5 reductase-like n=1 Tax=Anneissia japonica TaxID=1529436 RepID=UPI001425A452|nr:NADH-cytochrome b5 reductase-like [Anneissia japonica]
MDSSIYLEGDITVCEDCQVEKPSEPLQSDCCGTGCTPCVFDLYEEDLRNWRKHCFDNHQGGNLGSTVSDVLPVLTPSAFTKFELVKITALSEDTNLYRFKIPDCRSLGLSVGRHIVLRGKHEGRNITRQYTPVSPLLSRGFFDVFIKIYPNGPMSQYIKRWEVGQLMEWRGPYGHFTYTLNKYKHLVLLAAGTGLAPMLQVIQHIVNNDEEDTTVQLIYASKMYKDVLMKSMLDELGSYWNVTIIYVLSKDSKENVKARYGDQIRYTRLTKSILEKELTFDLSETYFVVCGTKSFDKDMIKYLKQLGINDEMYFKF